MSLVAQFPVAIAAGALGFGVGALGRWLLARLRRGTVLPAGPMEAALAAVWCASVLLTGGRHQLAAALWIGALMVVLSAVDFAVHRLPDAITYPAIGISLLLIGMSAWRAPGSGSLRTALLCAAIGTAVALGAALACRHGLGLGDVKLLPSLLLVTGYQGADLALLFVALAVTVAGLVAAGMVLARRWRPNTMIAFGPYLLLGAWVVTAAPAIVTALYGY